MTFPGEQAQRSRAYARQGAGGGPWLQFIKGFVKHPVMVGSVIPSSKMLIDKMLAPVDWANCKLFVEYGPGVGTFTEKVLDFIAPHFERIDRGFEWRNVPPATLFWAWRD